MAYRSAWILSCVLVLASCGGGGPVTASATVTGNIGGSPLAAPKTFMFELMNNGRVGTIYIVVAGADGGCEALKANKSFKNNAMIVLGLKNGKGDTLQAGSYGVNPDQYPNVQVNYSQGFVSRTDATCTETIASGDAHFTAGSVELTDYAKGTSATGTFNVTVGGQTVSGTFAANVCSGVTQAMIDESDTCS